MKRAETLPSLNPPEDPLITTLYIGGLGDEADGNPISEQDLRDHFYQYGEIRQITVVTKQGCAFIQVSFHECFIRLSKISKIVKTLCANYQVNLVLISRIFQRHIDICTRAL